MNTSTNASNQGSVEANKSPSSQRPTIDPAFYDVRLAEVLRANPDNDSLQMPVVGVIILLSIVLAAKYSFDHIWNLTFVVLFIVLGCIWLNYKRSSRNRHRLLQLGLVQTIRELRTTKFLVLELDDNLTKLGTHPKARSVRLEDCGQIRLVTLEPGFTVGRSLDDDAWISFREARMAPFVGLDLNTSRSILYVP